jgi:hypothetical protein
MSKKLLKLHNQLYRLNLKCLEEIEKESDNDKKLWKQFLKNKLKQRGLIK